MIRGGDGEIPQLLCCRQKHDRASPSLSQVMKKRTPPARTFHEKAKSLPHSAIAATATFRNAKWFNFIGYENADINIQLLMDDLHVEGGGKTGIISRLGCAWGRSDYQISSRLAAFFWTRRCRAVGEVDSPGAEIFCFRESQDGTHCQRWFALMKASWNLGLDTKAEDTHRHGDLLFGLWVACG
jgi:hypothetical protein